MELLQLRYFLESANTGSFTETAKKFMVPQSSVSITVRKLEKELGCQLFDRQANKLTLNHNGRKLQHSLANILGELDQVTAELSKKEVDHVEIGVLVKGLRSEIVHEIIRYQQQNPDVTFKSIFDYADDKYDNYDLVVTAEPIHAKEFEFFQLYQKKLYMRVASDNPLCGRMLTMKHLRDQPFLITSKSSPNYKILQQACAKAGFEPKIAMEINDTHHFARCIKSGLGIGLTRNSNPAADASVQVLNVTDFNEWLTYYVCYKSPTRHPQIQRFIDHLRCTDF